MSKKPTKTRKPKAKPIVEQPTQTIPIVEPLATKEETITLQSVKSINLNTNDKIYYDVKWKECKETLWEKFCDKISELEPSWFFRLRENIWGAYRDFTSSFSNWRKGYGWIPNSDLWGLDFTISKFVLPRLKLFIDKQQNGEGRSTPMDFAQMENGEQKWIETLIAMQPAFTEEEEWFKWKYPNRVHPMDVILKSDIEPTLTKKEGKGINPDWMGQYDWKEIKAIGAEHKGEQQKGIELFAKHFYSLWD